jgi:hypothetical protein
MVLMPQAATLFLARYILTIIAKKLAVSCPFFWTFPSCWGATEDFDARFFVYSMPFWNKFMVEETPRKISNVTLPLHLSRWNFCFLNDLDIHSHG